MVERKVRIEEDLSKETVALEESNNFVKATRFADEATKLKLNTWAKTVSDDGILGVRWDA